MLTPAAAGGPAPKAQDTLVVRWLGHTNYELTYRGNVFLLDAYYDRVPKNHPIGVAAKDVTKATAIFIGHAHYDHIADAGTIAKQTGATVVGASSAGEVLAAMGLPSRQFRMVKGGETLHTLASRYRPCSAATMSSPPRYRRGISTSSRRRCRRRRSCRRSPTPKSSRPTRSVHAAAAIRQFPTEGVIGYLFTFANDFRVMFADSAGPVTGAQRQLMQRVTSVDVAMLPYVNFEAGIPPLVELAKTFRPATVFLGHHDGPGVALWASNYPAALALRDALPKARTMDVLYRTPVCFSTASKEMFIGW